MQLIKQSSAVYLAEGDIAKLGQRDIQLLKSLLKDAPQGRVRINLHPSSEDLLHEMFIAIRRGTYIRAHKHPGKSEAFHVIEGSVRVVIFDDEGHLREVVSLEAASRLNPFYYRLSKPYFHTLLVDSDILVMHEITNGPFRDDEIIMAPFSPPEQDALALVRFKHALNEQLEQWEAS